MPELPLPQKPEGVLASVFLTVICFVIYYWIGFPRFLGVYESQFQQVEFDGTGCPSLSVKVRFPKWVTVNGSQWVYLSIVNSSDKPINNVETQIILPLNQTEVLLLPAYYEKNTFEDTIKAENLQPSATLTGRQLIFTNSDFSLNDVKLRVSCGEVSDIRTPNGTYKVAQNAFLSFMHSVLEGVLLPPWANGVIPFFVILSCWFFESSLPDQGKKDETK